MLSYIYMAEGNKSKHPGRVAWGKKLAQMSKELKEKKKKNDNEEIKLINKDISIDRQTEDKLNSHHVEVMVGVGGLIIAVVALYLQYKNNTTRKQLVNTVQTNDMQIDQQLLLCPHNYNYF